ncbi:MAG: hypothetical protein M1834_001777 [Cirrosporium novae-zelandiae]|nr:MAG: hypothetical protein M1834_001777 [Cirrosporium novae-zelandiae]
MPPRKSGASVVSQPADSTASTPVKDKDVTAASKKEEKEREKAERDGLSVEDLSLPRTIVQRLTKGVLPPNTQVQKDALLALSKAATVFVSYLSSSANESMLLTPNPHNSHHTRSTIQPQDVISALKVCEFEDFVPRLEKELEKYVEVQSGKRNEYRRRVREARRSGGDGDKDEDEVMEKDGEPVAKKARRSGGNGGGIAVNGVGGSTKAKKNVGKGGGKGGAEMELDGSPRGYRDAEPADEEDEEEDEEQEDEAEDEEQEDEEEDEADEAGTGADEDEDEDRLEEPENKRNDDDDDDDDLEEESD